MRLRWKILICFLGALIVLFIAATIYVFTREPPPAKIVDAGPTGKRIDSDGVFGNYFPANGKEAQPAILVLGGSEGGLAIDVTRQALALQKSGYNALHLAYHNAPHKTGKMKNIPVEDFAKALDLSLIHI